MSRSGQHLGGRGADLVINKGKGSRCDQQLGEEDQILSATGERCFNNFQIFLINSLALSIKNASNAQGFLEQNMFPLNLVYLHKKINTQ